ncbi:hypothetical protein [Singulisphaera sp. PoT]|uniref:hypothetical protein n=1 Tax=Singulisphaera sp. PoT TaxID=3411797 RepID=UPI003BF4CEC4
MAPELPREQDLSIKARKSELFEKQTSSGPRKPFAEYLERTAPFPLPQGQKILLWSLGAVVVILFLIAMLTMPSHQGGPGGRKAQATSASSR